MIKYKYMNDEKSQISEKQIALFTKTLGEHIGGSKKSLVSEKCRALKKSLSELLDIINEVESGNDDIPFVDNEGNELRLGIDVEGRMAMINLNLRQKDSNISIQITKPYEKMVKELEEGYFLDVCRKKK